MENEFIFINEYKTESEEVQEPLFQTVYIDLTPALNDVQTVKKTTEDEEYKRKYLTHSRCFPYNMLCAMICCVVCCIPCVFCVSLCQKNKIEPPCCKWTFDLYLSKCCCLTNYDCKK